MSDTFPEAELLLEIGHVAMAHGFLNDALEIMEGLVSIEPDAPHPRTGRALALFMLGEQELAIEVLQDSIKLFPQAVFARSLLARFLKQIGRPGADEVAREVLAMSPPDFIAEIALNVLGQELDSSGAEVKFSAPVTSIADEAIDRAVEARFPIGFRGKIV